MHVKCNQPGRPYGKFYLDERCWWRLEHGLELESRRDPGNGANIMLPTLGAAYTSTDNTHESPHFNLPWV